MATGQTKQESPTIRQQPVTPTSPEQRLDVKDLAAILRRSVSGTWAAVQRGELPAPERYGRRCTRWRWGTVLDHLNQQNAEN